VSSSLIPPVSQRSGIRPLWTQYLGVKLRSLVFAREQGGILIWDTQDRLHLFDRLGRRQATWRSLEILAGVCCADDGSAFAAISRGGKISWLAPDLRPRWQQTLPHSLLAAALEPLGQYLAIADMQANVYLLDRHGRSVFQTQSPRPLHHLTFVPAAAYLLGSADYGLVIGLDSRGHCGWRDGLVAHVGSLSVSGDGARILLACYSEGLQFYNLAGENLGRRHVGEPCRLATLSFDGGRLLAAGLGTRLLVLDRDGDLLSDYELETPVVALALAALGEFAVVAQANGQVLGLDLRALPSGRRGQAP
jgi:hypothetical protein